MGRFEERLVGVYDKHVAQLSQECKDDTGCESSSEGKVCVEHQCKECKDDTGCESSSEGKVCVEHQCKDRKEASGSCPRTCHKYTCDDWVGNGAGTTCEDLKWKYGCDCSGCSKCEDGAAYANDGQEVRDCNTSGDCKSPCLPRCDAGFCKEASGLCPATCHGWTCDDWVGAGAGNTYEVLTWKYGCDCSGCSQCEDVAAYANDGQEVK